MALSAPRLTRLRAISCKLETTKGTLAAPDSEFLAFDATMDPADSFVERKGSGKFLGHSSAGVLAGSGAAVASFKVELSGSGTSGMNPELAILLQACALKKNSEVYKPCSTHTDQKTISLDLWEDGKRKRMIGCSGTFQLAPGDGPLVFDFEFSGVWVAPVNEALPTIDHSTRAPISWANASNAFTLATKSIKISTFNFNVGNEVIPRYDNGRIAYYMVADRDPVWTLDPESDLVGVDGYDFFSAWLAGTEVALSLAVTDGTDTVTIAVPKFQYRELKSGDRDGIQTEDLTGQCNISDINTGDDEFTITVT